MIWKGNITQTVKLTLFTVSLVVCSAQLFSFISLHAPTLIYADRWLSMDPLFAGDSLWQGFFHTHGPHRMGLIYVLFKISATLSDWDSRWDMFLQWAIYVITALLALRLKILLFRKLDWWDCLIPCIFLTAHTALTITFNPFVHGLIPFFAISLSLSYFIQNRLLKQISLSILVLISSFSGFGLVCTLAVIIAEIIRFLTNRHATNYIVFLVAILTITFMVITQNESNPISLDQSWSYYLKYALWLLQSFVFLQYHEQWVWISLINVVLLSLILFKAYPNIRQIDEPRLTSLMILSGSSLLFLFLSLSGRADMGIGNALNSRYLPAVMPLMLSVYFAILYVKPAYLKTGALVLLTALLLRLQIKTDVPRIRNVISLTEKVKSFEDCLLPGNSYDTCEQEENFSLAPSSKKESLQAKLDYLKAHKFNIYKQEK